MEKKYKSFVYEVFKKYKNFQVFKHSVCKIRITNITKGINQRLKYISNEYNILKEASEKKEKKNKYNLSSKEKHKTLKRKRTKFHSFGKRPRTEHYKLLRLESFSNYKKEKTFFIDVNKHKLNIKKSLIGLDSNYNFNNSKISLNSSFYSRNNSIINNEPSHSKRHNTFFSKRKNNSQTHLFKQTNFLKKTKLFKKNYNKKYTNTINNSFNNINKNKLIVDFNLKEENKLSKTKSNKKKRKKIDFKKYIPHPMNRKLNDALANSKQLKKEILLTTNSFAYKDPYKLSNLLKDEKKNSFEKQLNKKIVPFFESCKIKKSNKLKYPTFVPNIDYVGATNLYKKITNLNPMSSYKFKNEIKKEMEIKIIKQGLDQIEFIPNNSYENAYKRPQWVIEKTQKSREIFRNLLWEVEKNIIKSNKII